MNKKGERPDWGDSRNFQMFSEHRIELAKEIRLHPVLIELLQKHPQDEFELLIAETACYCEVILDGDYMPDQLDDLCGLLYQKLMYKRTGILLAHMNIDKH